MERAASPHLRNSSFTSTRRYSTGMTPYHSLSGSNHSHSKRRLEFDDDTDDDAPHPLPSSATLAPPVRAAARAAQIASATYSSSAFHQQQPSSSSSWNHRHLDSHVLESNRSDHARHSRLLDFSNHSHKPTATNSGSRSTLAPPGRRVDSGDDERLEAPTRSFGRADDSSTVYGGSDDKSLATIASMRSRSVMSRQHSLLSLDNLSFSTELHVLMQRQASQSSLCSFASHAMHKRRNSWGSTCGGGGGNSVAGESTVPPYLLRLTSASSALDGKGGAASVTSVTTDKLRHRARDDDSSTGSWLQHVTSIRHDTTMMSHLRQDRLANHHHRRPANPIIADSFWLQQMSSRSLSSFTTITTTTTTRTTTNTATPPLPATLSLTSASMSAKGMSKTLYPSPEDEAIAPSDGPFRGTTDGTSANVQDPHQWAIPRKPGSSLWYSPEQPPYYQARRAEFRTKSSIRSLRFSDEASIVGESASASSQPTSLSAPLQQQQQQYQPPLPLQQVAQGNPSLHQERLSPPHGVETMELDEAEHQ